MRIMLLAPRRWAFAFSFLSFVSCGDSAPTSSQLKSNGIARTNEVPGEFEDLLDEFDPAMLADLHGKLDGTVNMGGGSFFSGPDKATFEAKTYTSAGTSAWVIQTGSMEEVGGWITGAASLFCTGLNNCNQFATGTGNCMEGVEWYAQATHRFVFKFGAAQNIGDTQKYLWCEPSVTYVSSGGGQGGCTNGYWQQYYYYIDGAIVYEWWEYECGYMI